MGLINRGQLSDLRGVVGLAVDATVGITDLVEQMHHTIQMGHPPLGTSRAGKTSGLTGFVYRSIRSTTRLLGQGLDAGMAPVIKLLPEEEISSTIRDGFVSAVNGVYGDHLVKTDNPLAIRMSLRQAGQALNLEQLASTGKVLLMVHGLCLNEGHWTRDEHNHGEALAADLGYTPVYLRYNTGLPIADNGRSLAGMLENLLREWPQPVKELVIVGHSMGGLLARSACYQGRLADHAWLQHLCKLVSIGTPHHGTPLERGGNWLDFVMDLSPYAAPFTRIARKRSAGITDLRYGSITDEAGEFVPLPTTVDCYAMAATLGKKQGRMADRLIGDGLVPLDSALGQHKDPARTLAIPKNHQWTGFETGHRDLLACPKVYAQLRSWLE